MNIVFIALLLGISEGLTEFIPVSSTGHLILFGRLLGFQGTEGKSFEIVIQLGAILAICWLYRRKIFSTCKGAISHNVQDQKFALSILVAVLPAMAVGAIFHRFITEALFNPVSVSIALIVGGVVILLVERLKPEARYRDIDRLPLSLALKIGLCQCIALIPGTSRSGATIMGALMFGVDRKVATEFSFFLAIPTMFAATFFDLVHHWDKLSFADAQLIAIGFTAAFVSALLVVKTVVAYVERYGFAPFAYYRIVFGAWMLYLFA